MKRSLVIGLALAGLVARAGAAEIVTEERIVPADRIAREIVVRDLRPLGDGGVSGTLVNRTGNTVRDVRLAIQHLWLWNNEFHPGTDDPSRVDYFTVPGEVPAGGEAAFTYRPSTPLPERRDGRYATDARVMSVVTIEKPGGGSPTAGTPGLPSARPPLGEGEPGQ